jgi:hypothetical protein
LLASMLLQYWTRLLDVVVPETGGISLCSLKMPGSAR